MNSLLRKLFFLTLLLEIAPYLPAQTMGKLFGMTYNGGSNFEGTLFSYDALTGKDTVLINFNGTNGAHPIGDVIQAKSGLLYGMSFFGGSSNDGVLFSYNLVTGKDSVVINFNGANGAFPMGNVVQTSAGFLYGITEQGGTWNYGVLYRYDPVTGNDTVLFNFNDTLGRDPTCTPLLAKDGKLYGYTYFGGTSGNGVLFRFDPLTNKDTVVADLGGANGSNPLYGSLVQDTNGIIYGLTNQGGTGTGVLFSYDPVAISYTPLVNFGALGNYPCGGMIHDSTGLLYGTTTQGGAFNNGVLFTYNPATGKDTTIINFSSSLGQQPNEAPMQASNGLLYGLTYQGGVNTFGTLYSYNTITGKDTVLVNFNNAGNGADPYGTLIEGVTATITGVDSLKCATDSNGWVKVTTRGCKLPINYLWNNGKTTDSIADLKGGSYVCTVTDARGVSVNLTITIYAPPPISLISSVSNVCFGDSNGYAFVNSTGGTPPYKYKWNTGATNDTIFGLKPGTYNCTVTDSNGCSSTTTCTITQATPFKIDSVVSTPASCPTCSDGTSTVYVSGGIPPGDSVIYYYTWTYGGDSATVSGIPPGYNSVCVTSGYYKCGSACDSTLVLTGIKSINGISNSVKVYPVPSGGIVYISTSGEGFEALTITDELGRAIYHTLLDANKNSNSILVDLTSQPQGIYFMQLATSKGMVTKKLVIER
jgi:uncharacterized repeat protein (TIGR03803 family)